MSSVTSYPTPGQRNKHTAFACHLGTFSLSRGLITTRGFAHRLGSVVIKAPMDIPYRERPDYMANCLLSQGIDCRACIERCPAGAITKNRIDKKICRSYRESHVGPEITHRYGIDNPSGRGLCQCSVPCDSCIPQIKHITKETQN